MSAEDTSVSHAKLLYTIVVAETASGLVALVHQALREGWRCAGGPFETLDDGLCQAMYRDTVQDRMHAMLDVLEQVSGALLQPPVKLIAACPSCGSPFPGLHAPDCPNSGDTNQPLFDKKPN